MDRDMEERWLRLWGSIGHQGDPEALYADLATRYAEPHRAYHVLEHIRHCLNELDEVCGSVQGVTVQNIVAVKFTLWYHDIFYDTHASDNEERSALYAQHVLEEAKAFFAGPELTASYIRVTAHDKEPIFLDEKLVLDIDLSILGQPSEIFDKYERQIRFEYSWVPEEAFRAGRAKILQRFLERPTIYRLKYFKEKYETIARENLQRSLSALT